MKSVDKLELAENSTRRILINLKKFERIQNTRKAKRQLPTPVTLEEYSKYRM